MNEKMDSAMRIALIHFKNLNPGSLPTSLILAIALASMRALTTPGWPVYAALCSGVMVSWNAQAAGDCQRKEEDWKSKILQCDLFENKWFTVTWHCVFIIIVVSVWMVLHSVHTDATKSLALFC